MQDIPGTDDHFINSFVFYQEKSAEIEHVREIALPRGNRPRLLMKPRLQNHPLVYVGCVLTPLLSVRVISVQNHTILKKPAILASMQPYNKNSKFVVT